MKDRGLFGGMPSTDPQGPVRFAPKILSQDEWPRVGPPPNMALKHFRPFMGALALAGAEKTMDFDHVLSSKTLNPIGVKHGTNHRIGVYALFEETAPRKKGAPMYPGSLDDYNSMSVAMGVPALWVGHSMGPDFLDGYHRVSEVWAALRLTGVKYVARPIGRLGECLMRKAQVVPGALFEIEGLARIIAEAKTMRAEVAPNRPGFSPDFFEQWSAHASGDIEQVRQMEINRGIDRIPQRYRQ